MNTHEPYIVLARKWRSAQFSDVVGQRAIVRTLMNAIRLEKVHHAYLFTGSRGIGKTSIARIFAKALRCPNLAIEKSEAGVEWLRSCDDCPACREITVGNGIDVLEIDGASNNGVEQVRDLREHVRIAPLTGKRKITIIDEVHMLTTAAFNALLKTLEEPPPHLVFIFCTTEAHKIPDTILSRCQRFDFRNHTSQEIQGHLARVCQAEAIQADPAALALIARSAQGSMRDALSLLDQVSSFSPGGVTPEAARESIGFVGGRELVALLEAIFARDALAAVRLAREASDRGHDLRALALGLVELCHAAVLARIGCERPPSLELSTEEWTEIERVARLRELEEIELVFQVLHFGVETIARSPHPRLALDVILVKCAAAETLVPADAMGAAGTPGTRGPGTPKAISPERSGSDAPPATGRADSPPAPERGAKGPATSARESAPVAPDPVPRSSSTSPDWEGFLARVRANRPLLASLLEHGAGSIGEGGVIRVFFPSKAGFHRDQLQKRPALDQLEAIATEHFGSPVKLRFESSESAEGPVAARERAEREREAAAEKLARSHPILREAQALFGGEIRFRPGGQK